MTLPIHAIERPIIDALVAGNRLVLSAPTGSGKTTQVPQFILNSPLGQKQIFILQPRRIAARLVAERVSRELNTPLGELVGYQTRHDNRTSPRTLIRFMTEGIFLRILQSNPTLDGVGTVILDEFHERNLATDTALALVKRLQETHRPDLRMIVMSATLDVKQVSDYLRCASLETHGRAFDVDIRYLDKRPVRAAVVGKIRRGSMEIPVWEQAADALADLLEEQSEGDVLMFMPGAYEIRRTIEQCERLIGLPGSLEFFPLYSELPPKEQDAALSPAQHRKVIVATNVAETSITIEGIRHVIDSGLARVNRFDPKRGINVLAVEPISQASAEQRAGRAGRTAPGTCTRLWLAREHRHRPAHSTPEIQRLDLAEVALQLKDAGIGDLSSFAWLQPPDADALRHALELLSQLDAINANGELAAVGKAMARLPMHPRLSRMLIEAARLGCLQRAALWAAMISEREILMRGAKHGFADELPEGPRSDFLVLERAFEFALACRFEMGRCADAGVNASACRELEKTRRLYLDSADNLKFEMKTQKSKLKNSHASIEPLAKSLLAGFPDHLANRTSESQLACALTRGRRGQLDPDTVARRPGLLLSVEIREIGAGNSAKTVLSMVSEVELDWLRETEGAHIASERVTVFNPATQAIETVEREVFDGLVVFEKPLHEPDRSAAPAILAEQVLIGALKLPNWDEAVEHWIARVRCVSQWFPERRMIQYDDDERRLILEEICAGAIRFKDIADRPCLAAVKDALSWEDQQFVETMAPERIELPRGWRMKIDYFPGHPPRGRAKIQDFYGLNQTPTIAGGRQKLLLEILGPNMRPVQLTDDLAGFWKNLYPEIRKELSRKYPRHEWR